MLPAAPRQAPYRPPTAHRQGSSVGAFAVLGVVLIIAVVGALLMWDIARTPIVFGAPPEPGQTSHACRLARVMCPDADDPAALVDVPVPEGLAADQELVSTLRATGRGRSVLRWLHDNKIRVVLDDAETGAYYSPKDNTMVLGPGYRTAMSVIHEHNHAVGDVHNSIRWERMPTRQQYIQAYVSEEVDGVVAEILSTIEFERAGVDGGSSSWRGEGRIYWAAYFEAKRRALDSGASEHGAVAVGRHAGRSAIMKRFLDGTVKTSTSGQSYVDTYGAAWDRANAG